MSGKNSIAEKTQKLEAIVAWFNGDDFRLEQALEKFAEAEKIAEEIEADLTQLKNSVDIVKKRFDESR